MLDVAKKCVLNIDCCMCRGRPAKVIKNELCLFHFLLWLPDVSSHQSQKGTASTRRPCALALQGLTVGRSQDRGRS
jgi:hypothetical protein